MHSDFDAESRECQKLLRCESPGWTGMRPLPRTDERCLADAVWVSDLFVFAEERKGAAKTLGSTLSMLYFHEKR